ncbi:MAG TPA: ATP-binding protein, partial [Gemmatimonadales bacterium]|nr:ATP-binding protein [Gemmatimonadales bacterium]
HDFNNLITGMRGYADLLLDDLPLDDPHRADLHEIQRASSRAADLTRQLLTFARRQVATPRLLDLNRVVRDAEPLLRKLLGGGVELVLELAEGVVPVVIDPAQFEQVLTNLATNARDAMPDGGRVVVETSIEDHLAALTVTDHGAGIPAEALPHLFEPFYTTKLDGKGTGLGLATVYGIVEQSDGRIEVESTVGLGTRMRILLPLSLEQPGQEGAPSSPVPMASGPESVLVVDDEIQIRDLCSRLLSRLGYTTYTAQDGHAALAILEAHPGIAVVVSDMVMPGMGGVELMAHLRELKPGLPVILMSGYNSESASQTTEGTGFLPKPFTVGELAVAVRRALDG